MGTVPSADRISSIESVAASGAKWTVPRFFHRHPAHGSRTPPTRESATRTPPSHKQLRSAGLEKTCGFPGPCEPCSSRLELIPARSERAGHPHPTRNLPGRTTARAVVRGLGAGHKTGRPAAGSLPTRLTVHGSLGSRLTAHGSRLTAHGSRFTVHGSRHHTSRKNISP